MKLSISASITGSTNESYQSGTLVSHSVDFELPDAPSTQKLETLTPEEIEGVRERLTAALKEAQKKLDADLDVKVEQAERREKDRKAQERKEAQEAQEAEDAKTERHRH